MTARDRYRLPLLLAAAAAFASSSSSPTPARAAPAGPPAGRPWNEPAEPFRIVGNVYFVGTQELGIFLITGTAGHILIDSGFESTVPVVRRSVQQLGFRFEDIKILLASHAHEDHVGGHARVRELTGARVLATAPDARTIRAGGGGKANFGMKWRPCPVDGVLVDGQKVSLGGTELTAHLTAGHTPGATSWTMTVDEGDRPLQILFFSSATLFDEVPLEGNRDYPSIAADFTRSHAFWKSVPVDVFLAPHIGFFRLPAKHTRLKAGATPNPFIDPAGWQTFRAKEEDKFRQRQNGLRR